jgi:hypothetical protein
VPCRGVGLKAVTTRAMASSSRQKEILDCRNGIWGTEKLHTETDIWRMIAQPDAHGESNQSATRSRMSYDKSAFRRRTDAVACTLAAEEACA